MFSSATAREIDSEIGDLKNDVLGGSRLLSYLRYDVIFNDPSLKGLLSAEQLESIAEMDRPENMNKLIEIGRVAASRIEDSHFAPEFDIA